MGWLATFFSVINIFIYAPGMGPRAGLFYSRICVHCKQKGPVMNDGPQIVPLSG
jgi:hypothetical protein